MICVQQSQVSVINAKKSSYRKGTRADCGSISRKFKIWRNQINSFETVSLWLIPVHHIATDIRLRSLLKICRIFYYCFANLSHFWLQLGKRREWISADILPPHWVPVQHLAFCFFALCGYITVFAWRVVVSQVCVLSLSPMSLRFEIAPHGTKVSGWFSIAFFEYEFGFEDESEDNNKKNERNMRKHSLKHGKHFASSPHNSLNVVVGCVGVKKRDYEKPLDTVVLVLSTKCIQDKWRHSSSSIPFFCFPRFVFFSANQNPDFPFVLSQWEFGCTCLCVCASTFAKKPATNWVFSILEYFMRRKNWRWSVNKNTYNND